jgi:hypothetical protein
MKFLKVSSKRYRISSVQNLFCIIYIEGILITTVKIPAFRFLASSRGPRAMDGTCPGGQPRLLALLRGSGDLRDRNRHQPYNSL